MVLVVTGSTGGIGSCVVKRALRSHAVEKIYGVYKDEGKRSRMYAGHPKLALLRHDASKQEEDRQLLQELYAADFKSIACVHTSFCISPILRAGMYSAEDIRKNIAVNVMDMVFLMNGLIQLKKAKGAELKVIQIDSGAAYKPLEGWALYSAAKAYTNMFLQSVQTEEPDVKLVSYEPGVVDTPMQEKIRKTDAAVCGLVGQFREYYEKGTLHSPESVAEDIFLRFVERWDAKQFREGYRS